MKKFFLGALCALGIVASVNAQETFRKNDNVLNLGIGLSSYSGTSLPPLSATYERSVIDGILEKGALGIGLQGELMSYKVGGLALFAGPRAAFHYEFVDNLDTYVGLQAGLYLAGSGSGVAFAWNGVFGARYYFNNKWGVFGELGTGLSVFKLGAHIRL